MSSWTKAAPTKPGWYWVELRTKFASLLNEDGLWDPGERDTAELVSDGARFGPAIPSAEAIELAREALRELIHAIDATRDVTFAGYTVLEKARAALAALESRP